MSLLAIKNTVEDVRNMFSREYQNQLGLLKSEPNSTIELVNVQFLCTEDHILRKPNHDYIKRELEWYESQSLNVNDIPGDVPAIWKQVSDDNGFVNSNYGWCIYSDDNFNQYQNCLDKLKADVNTRQAQMIYTRPSIQVEWNKNGMHDYLCTNYVGVFIRDSKLIYCVYQRSCDAVFGYNNDFAFHKHVYNKLLKDLKTTYYNLKEDVIQYTCGSLHVYPRHHHLVQKLH